MSCESAGQTADFSGGKIRICRKLSERVGRSFSVDSKICQRCLASGGDPEKIISMPPETALRSPADNAFPTAEEVAYRRAACAGCAALRMDDGLPRCIECRNCGGSNRVINYTTPAARWRCPRGKWAPVAGARHIVVVSKGLGDAILAIPCILALASLGASVDVLLIGGYAVNAGPLFDGLTGVRVVDLEAARAEPYDVAILSAANTTKLFPPLKIRAGHVINASDIKGHRAAAMLGIARDRGYDGPDFEAPLASRLGMRTGEVIIIGPDTGQYAWAQGKKWLGEKWAALIPRLTLPTVVIGKPEAYEPWVDLATENWIGKDLCISQLFPLLSRAACFIGPDSGLAHLASACGIPTVVIWGHASASVWRPAGNPIIVRPASGNVAADVEIDDVLAGVNRALLPSRRPQQSSNRLIYAFGGERYRREMARKVLAALAAHGYEVETIPETSKLEDLRNLFALTGRKPAALLRWEEHGTLFVTKEWRRLAAGMYEDGVVPAYVDYGYFDHYKTVIIDRYLADGGTGLDEEWPAIPDASQWAAADERVAAYRDAVRERGQQALQAGPLEENYVVLWTQFSTSLLRPPFKARTFGDLARRLADECSAKGVRLIIKTAPQGKQVDLPDVPIYTGRDQNAKLAVYARNNIICSSSVSNEFVLWNVPVTALGRSWFCGKGIFHEPDSIDDAVMPRPIDEKARSRWVNMWLASQCYPEYAGWRLDQVIGSIERS